MADPIMGWKCMAEYCKETAKGTTDTNPKFSWIGVIKLSLDLERSVFEEFHLKDSTATQHRIADSLAAGAKKVKFSYSYHPHVTAAGYEWTDFIENHVLGATTGAIDAPDPFTLNCVVTDAVVGTFNFVLLGCIVDSSSISCSKGGTPEVSVSGEAMTLSLVAVTMGAGSHAADPATRALTFLDAYCKVGGTGLTNLLEFNIEMNEHAASDYRMRSTTPESIAFSVMGKFEVKGKLTIDFQSTSLLVDMMASTPRDVALLMGGKTLTMLGAKFTKFPLDIDPERLIPVKLELTGMDVAIT